MLVLLALLEDLDELQGLQARDCGSGCCQGRDDAASLQLDGDPVHGLELVAGGATVAERVHEVDMEVRVIIFLKLIALDQVLLDPVCVSDWLLQIGIQLVKELKELILELIDLIDVLLLFFLLIFTLLFFLFDGLLIDTILDSFSLIFVGHEGRRSNLTGKLTAVETELFSPGCL